MFYRTRDWVNEYLRLSPRQSYRIISATPSGRIKDTTVLALLNRSRVGISQPLCNVPADLLTLDETISRFSDSEITKADLKRWTHRTRNAPPHFRLNRNTILFPASMLNDWLAKDYSVA